MSQQINLKEADELSGKYLSFIIADDIYAVELRHVHEILSVQAFTIVPGVPSYIKGITNLRGKVLPIIDVRTKFGLAEKAYDDKTCIIVVIYEGFQVGLIVDCVHDVVHAPEGVADIPSDSLSNVGKQYISSVIKSNHELILNIDFARFFKETVTI